jgi:hypothetical protein
MKRVLLALGLALLVSISLSMSVASASHSKGGGGSNKDFVSGTGKLSTRPAGFISIHVNVQSGPTGENPRGHLVVRVQDPSAPHPLDIDATAEVHCLEVRRGKLAAVYGLVERNRGADRLGRAIIFLGDRGEGNEPNDGFSGSFDLAQPEPFPIPDEKQCRRLGDALVDPTGPRPGVMTQGNFTVHDATP